MLSLTDDLFGTKLSKYDRLLATFPKPIWLLLEEDDEDSFKSESVEESSASGFLIFQKNKKIVFVF